MRVDVSMSEAIQVAICENRSFQIIIILSTYQGEKLCEDPGGDEHLSLENNFVMNF